MEIGQRKLQDEWITIGKMSNHKMERGSCDCDWLCNVQKWEMERHKNIDFSGRHNQHFCKALPGHFRFDKAFSLQCTLIRDLPLPCWSCLHIDKGFPIAMLFTESYPNVLLNYIPAIRRGNDSERFSCRCKANLDRQPTMAQISWSLRDTLLWCCDAAVVKISQFFLKVRAQHPYAMQVTSHPYKNEHVEKVPKNWRRYRITCPSISRWPTTF